LTRKLGHDWNDEENLGREGKAPSRAMVDLFA